MLRGGDDDSMSVMRDYKPDIAIIDVWSTDEPCPGWKLIEQLGRSKEFRTLSVVISTDDGRLEATLAHPLKGRTRILTKSYDWDALITAMSGLL